MLFGTTLSFGAGTRRGCSGETEQHTKRPLRPRTLHVQRSRDGDNWADDTSAAFAAEMLDVAIARVR
jgi:hypothetical protein